MKIGTLFYCIKEGVRNICRNVWFSLASTAIISACIFLFCLFFALVANVQYIVRKAETTVGLSVLFDESLTNEEIQEIGKIIKGRPEIKEMRFISEEEAWETFQKDYFKGVENLAEGFADDNPLAGSSSFDIFLYDINNQALIVSYLETIPGVRKVNYSNELASALSNLNKMLGLVSIVIIGILLAVAVFLISNTITTAAAFRKNENRIMRLIGATNFMIRAPFVVEGMIIGFVGAALPLAAVYFLYREAVEYMLNKFNIISNVIEFIPIHLIFPYMVLVAMVLGVGIGFNGSFFTIRKHLKV